ncbi:6,7-dimethyl-8-ribityllumazine synthase [Legionella yabuuchiae]|uniref:6,7-dimethyl-8-ribityllumazine synthase n=1 Tax=Legionella yabuuchiae TaxID=376727 RepID=UPI001054E152|nr:6,7-dimethyl-8-ribityllumazine synthase [Legionella yabuuchiae]
MKLIKGEYLEHHASFPIAIVVSRFNQDITQALLQGTLQRLRERGILESDTLVIEVPGAVEIPLITQRLAMKNEFKAIIALGAVIRGETTHYDYVCQQVSQGCQQVSLMHNVPVIFGVLTTENEEQAWDRLGGNHGHKGMDVADAAIEMNLVLDQL